MGLCDSCVSRNCCGYANEDVIQCGDFWKAMTNADRIRAMSDEELANLLYNGVDAEYCSNDPACAALLDTPEGVPEQKCIGCLMKWLKQPAED